MGALEVNVQAELAPHTIIRELWELCSLYPGNQEVLIHIDSPTSGQYVLQMRVGVDAWNPKLREEIEALLGDAGSVAE